MGQAYTYKEIEKVMFFYVLSSINHILCHKYFFNSEADKYINPEVLYKCRNYIYKNGASFVTFVGEDLWYLARTAYNNIHSGEPNAAFDFMEKDASDFFQKIYSDVDFLSKIEPGYYHVCKDIYQFVEQEICGIPEVIRCMGLAYSEFILNGYHNSKAEGYMETANKVIREKFQISHPDF